MYIEEDNNDKLVLSSYDLRHGGYEKRYGFYNLLAEAYKSNKGVIIPNDMIDDLLKAFEKNSTYRYPY